MGLIVLVVACAIGVGWALGGRLATLAELPVRHRALLLAAVLVQVVGALAAGAGMAAGPTAVGSVLVSGTLAAVFCAGNRRAHGVALAGVGLLCNGLVIGLNGAMPVSHHAATRAGVDWSAVRDDARHEPAGDGTVLRPLGDVVPVPLPGRPEVASAGDLLVAAGLAQFVLSGMLSGGAPAGSGGSGAGARRSASPAGSARFGGSGPRRGGRMSVPGRPVRPLRPEPRRQNRATADDRRQRPRRERLGNGAYQAHGEIIEVESELVRVITRRGDGVEVVQTPDPE